MSHRFISLDDASAWHTALQGIPHGIAHGWAHCHAMALSSGNRVFLYVGEAGANRLVCPFAERPIGTMSDLVTPYGQGGFTGIGDLKPLVREWLRVTREGGQVCAYVALNPVFARAADLGCEAMAARHHGVHLVDLKQTETALRARLTPNVQAGLKTWARGGARIVDDRTRLARAFPDLYLNFIHSIDAAPVYHFNRTALEHVAASPDVLLLGAERGGELQAIAAFGMTRFAADYLFNAATEAGRDHARALIWEAMRRLAADGVPVLNLSGGVSDGDGLDQFKARFGGTRRDTEVLKIVLNERAYAELCAAAGADPMDRVGYFPAYRASAGGRQSVLPPHPIQRRAR